MLRPSDAAKIHWLLRATCLSLVCVLGVFVGRRSLSADVVRLKTGGEVRGVVKSDSARRPRTTVEEKDTALTGSSAEILIETLPGTEISVVIEDVAFITKRPRIVEEYETQTRRVADTVEARWALAEWCRQHGLVEPRKEQLRRILELDPEHKQARYGLGHRRRDNRWISADEADAELTSAGYVRYKGRVVTTQERDLLESGAARYQQQNEWRPRIRLWLGWLTGRDARRQAEAVVQFRELRDAEAVPAIVDYLLADPRSDIRRVAVQVLAQIDGSAPIVPLARVAIMDADHDLQSTAWEAIPEDQLPTAISVFEHGLKDESNAVVRRAALLLGRSGSRSVVPALIDALSTVHPVRIAVPPAYSVGLTRSISSSGHASPLPPEIEQMLRNGQLPQGVIINPSGTQPVGKWVTVRRTLQNPEARESLRKLADQDFGFDKRAWRLWWQAQTKG